MEGYKQVNLICGICLIHEVYVAPLCMYCIELTVNSKYLRHVQYIRGTIMYILGAFVLLRAHPYPPPPTNTPLVFHPSGTSYYSTTVVLVQAVLSPPWIQFPFTKDALGL
jgi:hypothetical protein